MSATVCAGEIPERLRKSCTLMHNRLVCRTCFSILKCFVAVVWSCRLILGYLPPSHRPVDRTARRTPDPIIDLRVFSGSGWFSLRPASASRVIAFLSSVSSPLSFSQICRRAAGRRRFNAARKFLADQRRLEVARLLLNDNSVGAQSRIAGILKVSEATISRDVAALERLWRVSHD